MENLNSTIPLSHINIIGYMLDNFGKINCELTFQNNFDETINPIYYFSLDNGSTICNFTMLIDYTVFKGEVKEKKEARQTYTKAQTEGKKTALIEKISSNDYKVSVGNIEPGQNVIISYDYVIILNQDNYNSQYKLTIPTNQTIKYFSSNQTKKDTIYHNEISKIVYSSDAVYPFDFELRWLSSNKLIEFESNIDSIQIENIEKDKLIIFRGTGIPLQGEINLFVKTETNSSGYVWYDRETSKGYVVSNVSIPKENIDKSKQLGKNYQFILDRSGSMYYSERIKKAIESLKIFIEKIPSESYFNIISFGTDYSSIWSNSVPAQENFKNECLAEIKTYYKDNLGSTEIYDCLNDCFNFNFKKYKSATKKTCPESYENVWWRRWRSWILQTSS
jgi:hypothetical protein